MNNTELPVSRKDSYEVVDFNYITKLISHSKPLMTYTHSLRASKVCTISSERWLSLPWPSARERGKGQA